MKTTDNETNLNPRPDIGPGDAVAGAAKFALDRIREWESDNLTDGTERDWHGHVGPALARLASTLVAQPEPVAGAAPRRASGPIDPEAGFATSGAEARWLGDVDAGVYDDAPEEIGILQARVEDQDREWADLMRQLQGQPRRQSDVNAGGHPTESQIASVCLSYRHDFGLLSEHQRELIMFEGLEWLRAWRREFSSLPKPVAGAAQDGAAEREIDALRLKAFRTNAPSDREAYFMATSKWFQDRHYRYMAARKGDSHE